MANLVNKIVKYILERRKQKLESSLAKMKGRSYTNSTTKTHIDGNATIIFSAETMKKIEQMDEEVKNIVKPLINQPEKMLEFIEEHGTPVYRFSFAKYVLDLIKEEEGFITPLRGIKALFLNFAIGVLVKKKCVISFNTKEMFVLRNGDINIYYMLHQFHKWFGYKENLPGYDTRAQELFKENLNTMTDDSAKEMTIEEILALKEAIARDSEAAEFVINLAKESTGAKKAHEKMQQDGGAQI